jgi:hypothetical protein
MLLLFGSLFAHRLKPRASGAATDQAPFTRARVAREGPAGRKEDREEAASRARVARDFRSGGPADRKAPRLGSSRPAASRARVAREVAGSGRPADRGDVAISSGLQQQQGGQVPEPVAPQWVQGLVIESMIDSRRAAGRGQRGSPATGPDPGRCGDAGPRVYGIAPARGRSANRCPHPTPGGGGQKSYIGDCAEIFATKPISLFWKEEDAPNRRIFRIFKGRKAK